MDPGKAATIWLARIAVALYALSLLLLAKRSPDRARIAFLAGVAVYLLHVIGAFHYFYNWSHAIAERETARQTAELFGVQWNGGLYINYLFTAIWLADGVWWWLNPRSYRERPVAVSAVTHAFLAFIVLNASVVVWTLRWLRY